MALNANHQDDDVPEHLTASRATLEAKLDEGLASPAREMTPADWDDMRRRFFQRHPTISKRFE